jgi:hypothetical protein
VANPEERAEFIARLEENNQRLEAELEQKGLLDAVQQAEEQDRIENAAAQPPIGSLAELYPDDEPTAVSNSEIVGQTVADTVQGEQEILAAGRDVQQTEQQLATAEAELAGTQQEIVDTVRAGGEPTTAQLETLAAQESEVAALEEQLATDEQALVSTQEAQGVDPDPTTLTAAEQAADPEVSAFEEQQVPEAVALAEIDTAPAPVAPATDPEIPQPTIAAELPTAPPPDEAFLEAEAVKENRWIQAASTNPENINDNGSVTVDLGDGRKETINRDGSYEISGGDGTFRFDAAGQQTSYTTPTIDGVSVTSTTDGVQVTNITQGPLTTSTITKDGEPISTTVSYDFGLAQATAIETVGGQPVFVIEERLGDGRIERTVTAGEETTQEQIQLQSKQVATADAQAIAENNRLREELIAAKEQTAAGIPLSDTQIAALEEQAQATAAADAALFEAEQALAEVDPTRVPAGEDPQVDAFVDPVTDPVPSLDTVEVAAENVDPAADPEVAVAEAAQAPEEVPLAEIETEDDTELTPEQEAADPEVVEPLEEFVSDADIETEDDTELTAEEEAADPEVVEPLEEFVSDADIETEDDTELTAEEEAADPEITPEDDFVLSAADIDGGEDLDQDPGPGYGDVDEPLDPDILDRANEVEVDPYEDVLGRDLTEEEIQAEDNPVDYDLEEEIDPYNAISDRDAEELSPEEIQAEDNPVDYDLEEEIDPYNAIADRDLTEEEIQAEDNPIDYNTEDEIDPYNAISDRDEEEGLTDEEIDAARADQQVEFGPDGLTTLSSAEAAQQQATLDRARQQATLQAQRKQANDGDWRVRLRLASGAQYLYRAEQPGILQPLAVTDGVVFPYTPSIQTVYKANYSAYDLTHSNYRGYFYQGSAVEDIQITAKFTAQDSNEANYLLAVIHFFRSITKMFYGKDPQRGTPPPLVFLQGFGEYQFNLAPCVVAQFNYTLPDNVDYIRAGSPNINGTNLLQRRDRQNLPTDPFTSAYGRIQSVLKPQGIKKGAVTSPPAPPTLGTNRPTYVPTAMDISIILHPIQSRSQVSKQFSLQQYASGDLLKGGFW